MRLLKLTLRSLWFYRKAYLAIFAGAFISVTVLTGALIVGDSVKYSLNRINSVRLGKIRYALEPKRCFPSDLTARMSRESGRKILSLLETQGIAISGSSDKRINLVKVYGIGQGFLEFWDENVQAPGEDEAIVGLNTAQKLDVKTGDEVLLRLVRPATGIENAPFSADRVASVPVRVKITKILGDEGPGRFSLKSNQAAPYNIFLRREQMEKIFGLKGQANVALADELPDPALLLRHSWQPEDAGIFFRKLKDNKTIEINTGRIFFKDDDAAILLNSVTNGYSYITYLVNDINDNSASTPYSFVTATNAGLPGNTVLHKGEIVINSWLAGDLNAKVNDKITLRYFLIKNGKTLVEKQSVFTLKDIIPIADPLWDPSLMPAFPGISDAINCRDWETGSPIDLKKIRPVDEDYWKKFHGTPKAFISLEDGMKMWSNSYGTLTSIRFPASGNNIQNVRKTFTDKGDPATNQLTFNPVFVQGKAAAANSTDFGGLFLSLSFFLIIAGLLLMCMMFSMQIDGRTAEIRTLRSLGFSEGGIIKILYPEMFIVLMISSITGALSGILYNNLILQGLKTLWNPAVGTSDLVVDIQITTLITGALSGIVVAAFLIFFLLKRKSKKALDEKKDPFFFLSENKRSSISSFRIIIRGLMINKWRNLGITGLIAMGTFVILLTTAYHRSQTVNESNTSGTGGFRLWAETTVPFPAGMNEKSLKEKAADGSPDDSILFRSKILFLPAIEINDASCLNLNQVKNPSLTGIPEQKFQGRFSFSSSTVISSKDSLWDILGKEISEGIIPGFADETVIRWGLGKKTGDTLFYTDESGQKLGIKLIAGLNNSIFQGTVLISEKLMWKYFPSLPRNSILLFDCKKADGEALAAKLEHSFSDYGMMITPAAKRLEMFDAVQNTYLSVFMLLGGLGILLSTFGLGFFFVRDLISRQSELRLYNSFGLGIRKIVLLASGGYIFILLSGILIGIIALLIPLIILFNSSAVPFPWLLETLAISLVLLSGLLWIWLSVKFTGLKKLHNPDLME